MAAGGGLTMGDDWLAVGFDPDRLAGGTEDGNADTSDDPMIIESPSGDGSTDDMPSLIEWDLPAAFVTGPGKGNGKSNGAARK